MAKQPTARERTFIQPYLWGHQSYDWLVSKIGANRAKELGFHRPA